MQKKLSLLLTPEEAASQHLIKNRVADAAGIIPEKISGFQIIKKSLDARGKIPRFLFKVNAFIDEPYQELPTRFFQFQHVSAAKRKVIIIGAGPAGLFAALKLMENGIKPVILERGKDVRSRRRDLAALNKHGILNPESNYCFGEGGAGTYSDGKLYTRSVKRGDVNRILHLLVHFGAEKNILYESRPHIGTNKLPQIITEIRNTICAYGGEFHFEHKAVDFEIKNNRITKVYTSNGVFEEFDAVILATGHSARDIFSLLFQKNISLFAKPFALGVRVEHPQSLIDSIQFHCAVRGPYLPPAYYNFSHQISGRGAFSFCMCPGGIIAPASTSPGELVVNGWSPSKRNNPFANSGLVTEISEKDWKDFKNAGPLAGMLFQQSVEKKAYEAGGGNFVAPAQRIIDFCENRFSSSLPDCSYIPGINPANIQEIFPSHISNILKQAIRQTEKKMKGYYTREAIIVATESRTSSPVRIPRDEKRLHHPQVCNLYPCGEGAGYAGGIVSAAMDGEKIAEQIAVVLGKF
ncbi:MAG: NAD(P)/FAD-dependent oxidoreductase [Chitinophagaceae bacterium]|nr:NAD(P)/FAD-dependent oxidoreductase [Chitinophagaceae bacterium]